MHYQISGFLRMILFFLEDAPKKGMLKSHKNNMIKIKTERMNN